ncbi:hypothetical protein ACWDYJ_32485 [Streptomyces sp. NPDC003042]
MAVRDATVATGRSSAWIRQTMELNDGTRTYKLTATGDFDLDADRGQLGVDFPEGGISHVDEIFADGNVYVRGAANLPEGTWGAMARDKTEAHYLLRAPVNDPEHILQQISTLTQVTRVGEEDVYGRWATRYRGILADDAVTLRMAPEPRGKIEQLRAKSPAGLPVPADVWIDTKGRVVQARLEMNMPPTRSVTTVTFAALGKPVQATPPPAGDTVPVTTFSGILTG